MDKVIIAVPLYKAKPTAEEVDTLLHTFKVLHKYPFSFFCPDGFDFSFYEQLLNHTSVSYSIKYWPSKCFRSTSAYSRLLLRVDFYYYYKKYEYILICQPDVWVFQDRLMMWCNRGFDYIGAPFLLDDNDTFYTTKTPEDYPSANFYVGNGGCSLRRTSKMIKILTQARRSMVHMRSFSSLKALYKEHPIKNLPSILWRFFHPTNILCIHLRRPTNEDYVLCFPIRQHFPFSSPSPEEAAQFAIETYPQWWLTKMQELPFAWHAYLKYDKKLFEQIVKRSSLSNSDTPAKGSLL